jgi:hypothetical protein
MPSRHQEEEQAHRGKAAESDEEDATPGILLKHPDGHLQHAAEGR